MRYKQLFSIMGAGFACAVLFGQGPSIAEIRRLDPSAFSVAATVDGRFQSYNLEMAQVIGGRFWKPYAHMTSTQPPPGATVVGGGSALYEARAPADLSNPRLRTLAAALGPAYIRVSGTWANTVYFQNDEAPPTANPPEGFRGVLTRAQWRGVVDFARAVDAKLVTSFTINPAVRDSSGLWTSMQAQALIDFTHSIGGEIVAAELFNEPNFSSQGGGPKQYDGAAFARDMAAFHAFASKNAPTMRILGPGDAAIGVQAMPGSTQPEDLAAAEPRAHFDIFDYHFYGAISQRCAPPGAAIGTRQDQALSEDWLARTDTVFDFHKGIRDRYAPGVPVWLTETADAGCGGNPWAAGFLDTFRYVDQLGRLAKRGVSVIFHNTLDAGEYGMIDEETLNPRPTYWAAVLWRRLMGPIVLDAGSLQDGLHVYAHCLRDRRGGVALVAINLGDTPMSLDLGAPAELYSMTAGSPDSAGVLLNGQLLTVGSDNRFPRIRAQHVKANEVVLPNRSINYMAMFGARNPHCG